MRPTLSVSNYRCFGREPVTFELADGFVAYLGKNNAGKSCLFRLIYELRAILKSLDYPHLHTYMSSPNTSQLSLQHLSHKTEIFSQHTDSSISIKLELRGVQVEKIVDALSIDILRPGELPQRTNDNIGLTTKIHCPGFNPIERRPNKAPATTLLNAKNGEEHDTDAILNLCQDLANAAYFSSFRSIVGDYRTSTDVSFDMTLGKAFILKWKGERGNNRSDIRNRASKVESDIARLFDYQNFRLEAAADDKTLLATINGMSHPIEALGAGIAEGVMMIANAAILRPSWILIDEPELHLHAALQDRLLQVLSEYCTRGVMFTTHNVGLAYHIASSKYVVTQNTSGISSVKEWESSRSLIETVAAMSFSSWKEVGYDQILLVEGSTEVPLFQNLLTLYGKGSNVFVWSLGGASTIRSNDLPQLLTEFKRLGSKVSAIIDSERADASTIPSERRHFAAECAKADIQCHLTEKRATENYLTAAALSAALEKETPSLTDYEDFKNHPKKWPKSSNFRIGRLMTKEDWDATDIGRFLQAL